MSTSRTPIDWGLMRQRMSQSQLALEKGFADDPRHTQRIYHARAARLARPETPPSSALAESRVLVFLVNSERYAIELQQVLEVIAHPNITPVPGSPRNLCGVINLRGEIRPVWDTALLLELAEQPDRPPGCVLLLRRASRPCGLRIDEIQDIRSLPPADWQAPAEPSRFTKAITSDMITLLETEGLLTEEPSR